MRVGFGRSNRHLVVWVALFLAICNAVAPDLLRMAAVARGEQVVEICTAFGIQRVDSRSSSGKPAPASPDTACKFCLGSQSPCAPLVAQGDSATPAFHPAPSARLDQPFIAPLARIFSGPRGPPTTV